MDAPYSAIGELLILITYIVYQWFVSLLDVDNGSLISAVPCIKVDC